jgi:RNA polymerase sigma-70 factor (ECF subfamily)
LTDDDRTTAFYALIWPYRAAVLRVAKILTGNDADADDLAQDTMVKAFRFVDRFAAGPGAHAGTDAKPWLMTILRNARIDRVRSAAAAGKATVSLDALGAEHAGRDGGGPSTDGWDPADPPQQILAEFSDQDVIDALQRLPEEIRWTLLLVDVEGVRHDEAADVLGVPAGTIKSRAHRGRGMLRQALLPIARDRRLIPAPTAEHPPVHRGGRTP